MDVRGVSGEISVHPTRLVFTSTDWAAGTGETVSVYAGEDFDVDNDEATLTHAISGGDYTDVPVPSVEVLVTDDDTNSRQGYYGESDTAVCRSRHQ